jgi:serine/threonine-protein kinase
MWDVLGAAAVVILVLVVILFAGGGNKAAPVVEAPKQEMPMATEAPKQEAQRPTEAPKVEAQETTEPPKGAVQVSAKGGMEMVYVPAGEFAMGSENGDSDEKPVHSVYLDGYWIDKTEVTNGMYQKCVQSGGCMAPHGVSSYTHDSYYGNATYENYPVIKVDWNQASAYCQWAGGRLPSEADWEKAARGPDGRTYPWGEGIDCGKANYRGKSGNDYCIGDTTAVGSDPLGASPYGALDMAGNVWEWVNDWYDKKYYANSPVKNPAGSSDGSLRVLRGGSWSDNVWNVRTAIRIYNGPSSWVDSIGFRCVRFP